MLFLPTNSQIPLCHTANDKVGDPRHEDVLPGVPEVGEDVHIERGMQAKHLDEGVVHCTYDNKQIVQKS